MSRISKSVAAVVTALACAGLAYASSASADSSFNYLTQQGRLLDQTGAPVDGTDLLFTFSLYTAKTGGTPIWTEKQTITPDKGYFSARLGEMAAIDPKVFQDDTKTYYLGIQIGTDSEMAPRQTITAVPFAVNAKFADAANTAKSATTADSATTATTAGTATSAGHATTADSATHATNADAATNATHATNADLAANVSSIKSLFSAATVATGTTTATATCASGLVATGGGCSGSGQALSVVSFSGSKTAPTGYTCSCPTCSSLTASAACVK